MSDHQLPDGVTIRRATPQDAEALAHLHLDVWDEAYAEMVPQEILDARREPHNVDARVATWREITTQPVTPMIAIGPEGPIGFAKAGDARDNDVDTEVELWSLYVSRAYWGTGVGYALFESEVGDRAAYVWVLAANARAIAFYERQGFRLDGTEDEHDEGLHVRMLRAGT